MSTTTSETEVSKRGLSGSTLKIIAIITMFIDHIGAAIFENADIMNYLTYSGNVSKSFYINWTLVDLILRLIGRVAFPIFCFLLVEGFLHTRDVKKYALRLGVFCLISELPFNLAFFGQLLDSSHQNVFFTLLIGLLVLIGLKHFEGEGLKNGIPRALCIIAGVVVAVLLKTDYDAFGVCVIVFFYLFHDNKKLRNITTMLSLILASLLEITGLFALIPIHMYNGQRGLSMKYFFYLFYPVHLLLLYGIGQLLLRTVFC